MFIDGTYFSTIYRNESTGETLFKFKYFGPARDRIIIKVHAIIPLYVKEMPLRIDGDFLEGEFYALHVYEKISDREISIAYLSNKTFFKGIGPKRAQLIVDELGPDIFSIIENDTELKKLKKLKGLPENVCENLIVSIRNTLSYRRVFEFMLKYYGSALPALKIADKYKSNAMYEVSNNPYICSLEFGVPFATSDIIAKDLGFNYLDKKRLEAIVYEAMIMSESIGHTFVYQSELNKLIKYIIKNSAFPTNIPFSFFMPEMMKYKWLKIETSEESKTKIYLKSLWLCETESARHVNRLKEDKIVLPFRDDIVSEVEKINKIKYHKLQEKTFDLLKTTGVKILTGGPGTGKTTLLNGLITAFEILNPKANVVLCSPTGRAAQRMKEQTGRNASTIHKLLDIKPFNDALSSRISVEKINADFIIVDEFSMIDIEILSIFLKAIRGKTLVLFVGDIDQLPSVGPGNVLKDLIKSGAIETYMLKNIYRQSEGSVIVENASKVINGDSDLIFNDSFKLIKLKNNESFKNKIDELTNSKDFDVNNTQILTTVKQLTGGSFEINKLIQKKTLGSLPFKNNSFMIGDKIIINKNNYEIGVFNGDLGFVKHMLEDGIEVEINGEDFVIPFADLDILSLAYAITIHKSQGSEFENIIIVLSDEAPNMLQRNLLYTAITRAKKNVIILSKKGSFEKAVKNNEILERNSLLYSRIK